MESPTGSNLVLVEIPKYRGIGRALIAYGMQKAFIEEITCVNYEREMARREVQLWGFFQPVPDRKGWIGPQKAFVLNLAILEAEI